MNRRIILMVIAGLAISFMCACAHTKLTDYPAKTPKEREVLDFLIQCDEALQYKKMSIYGDCFHENALIQVFGANEREVTIVSKTTFTELFLDRNKGPTSGQNIIDPVISVHEKNAQMHYIETEGGQSESVMVSFEMIKENDRWYFISYRWHWLHKIQEAR